MRKKTTFVFAVALLPIVAAAGELKPGTIQVTGSSTLGLASGNEDVTVSYPGYPDQKAKTDLTSYGFDLGALYYLTPLIGVGADIGYGSTKREIGYETTTSSDLFIGPKVGLDFAVAPQFSIFGDLSIGLARSGYKFEDTQNPDRNGDFIGTGWGARLGAGVKYFPAPPVSLDLGIRYAYSSTSYDYREFGAPADTTVDTKTSDVGVLLGISVYFGG